MEPFKDFSHFTNKNTSDQLINLLGENCPDSNKNMNELSFEFVNQTQIDMPNSEGTSDPNPSAKRTAVDRSRTLISDRQRRGSMKENLYALRSLVPNITKMDKASIVGDAVAYVQELQKQAEKLRVEISSLESFLNKDQTQGSDQIFNFRKILQMDLFEVEERVFYARIVCMRGEGVAVALYKALESLTYVCVESSNLTTLAELIVLTFTIKVIECEDEVSAATLKLGLISALLYQGFDFNTPMVP